jgi:hypothetical protein
MAKARDALRERARQRGEHGGIDGACGHASEDARAELWIALRDVPQEPDLVGGRCAASTEHDREFFWPGH